MRNWEDTKVEFISENEVLNLLVKQFLPINESIFFKESRFDANLDLEKNNYNYIEYSILIKDRKTFDVLDKFQTWYEKYTLINLASQITKRHLSVDVEDGAWPPLKKCYKKTFIYHLIDNKYLLLFSDNDLSLIKFLYKNSINNCLVISNDIRCLNYKNSYSINKYEYLPIHKIYINL